MRIKDLAKVALTTLVTVVVMVAVTAMQPDLGLFHVSEAFLDSLRRRDFALGVIAFACALIMLRVLSLRTWLGMDFKRMDNIGICNSKGVRRLRAIPAPRHSRT